MLRFPATLIDRIDLAFRHCANDSANDSCYGLILTDKGPEITLYRIAKDELTSSVFAACAGNKGARTAFIGSDDQTGADQAYRAGPALDGCLINDVRHPDCLNAAVVDGSCEEDGASQMLGQF
ncbi:MAG: hypothetical protein OXC91_09035 [Rhodobacteraceae bacterium]|nr:hypothetical protein [Paracoccaceae bacterium]